MIGGSRKWVMGGSSVLALGFIQFVIPGLRDVVFFGGDSGWIGGGLGLVLMVAGVAGIIRGIRIERELLQDFDEEP